MGRKVYFSFHYQDVIDFRVNVVRNSGKFRTEGESFRDASIWEEAKEKQVKIIKSLIDKRLIGTSVNCVLIGSETYSRRWVRYELIKSFEMKKGQVGVGINWIKDKYKKTKFWPGENPFEHLKVKISKDGRTINFFEKKDNSWVAYKDLPSIKNSHFKLKDYGKSYKFSSFYKKYSYDWENGKTNFQKWIDEAAKNIGR